MGVQIIERWILARLRHHTFFSLTELNQHIHFLLEEVNNKPFKQLKGTRQQWFDSIDTTYANAIEGKVSKEKALVTIAKNVKSTPRKLEKLIKKFYKKYFKNNKELYKFAYALKKKGYKAAETHFRENSIRTNIDEKSLVKILLTKKFK